MSDQKDATQPMKLSVKEKAAMWQNQSQAKQNTLTFQPRQVQSVASKPSPQQVTEIEKVQASVIKYTKEKSIEENKINVGSVKSIAQQWQEKTLQNLQPPVRLSNASTTKPSVTQPIPVQVTEQERIQTSMNKYSYEKHIEDNKLMTGSVKNMKEQWQQKAAQDLKPVSSFQPSFKRASNNEPQNLQEPEKEKVTATPVNKYSFEKSIEENQIESGLVKNRADSWLKSAKNQSQGPVFVSSNTAKRASISIIQPQVSITSSQISNKSGQDNQAEIDNQNMNLSVKDRINMMMQVQNKQKNERHDNIPHIIRSESILVERDQQVSNEQQNQETQNQIEEKVDFTNEKQNNLEKQLDKELEKIHQSLFGDNQDDEELDNKDVSNDPPIKTHQENFEEDKQTIEAQVHQNQLEMFEQEQKIEIINLQEEEQIRKGQQQEEDNENQLEEKLYEENLQDQLNQNQDNYAEKKDIILLEQKEEDQMEQDMDFEIIERVPKDEEIKNMSIKDKAAALFANGFDSGKFVMGVQNMSPKQQKKDETKELTEESEFKQSQEHLLAERPNIIKQNQRTVKNIADEDF